MTVSVSINRVMYTGNGSTTQWDIPFPFLSKEDLEIYTISSDGTQQLVTADFSVNEVSKVLTYPLQTNGASPLASSTKLLIMRATPLLQQTSFGAQETLDPSVLEAGYDKAILIAQDLAEKINRAILFPAGASTMQTDAQAYLNQLNTAVTTAQSAASSAQSAASTAANDTQAAINSHTDEAIAAEELARQTADALKLDISTAANTYLTQSGAAATYLTQEAASSNYLKKTDAASIYLTQTAAANTYLTQTNAASTYMPLSQKAAANGVASLDASALIPATQIPTIDGGNANA